MIPVTCRLASVRGEFEAASAEPQWQQLLDTARSVNRGRTKCLQLINTHLARLPPFTNKMPWATNAVTNSPLPSITPALTLMHLEGLRANGAASSSSSSAASASSQTAANQREVKANGNAHSNVVASSLAPAAGAPRLSSLSSLPSPSRAPSSATSASASASASKASASKPVPMEDDDDLEVMVLESRTVDDIVHSAFEKAAKSGDLIVIDD